MRRADSESRDTRQYETGSQGVREFERGGYLVRHQASGKALFQASKPQASKPSGSARQDDAA